MAGRRAYPMQLIDSKAKEQKLGRTKLENRRKNEVKVKSCELKCPEHLSDNAKEEWERIVTLYRELEQPIITDLDVNALEIYCESMVTYRNVMKNVKEGSEVYEDEKGVKMNPYLKVANQMAELIKKYGEILLLDPVSRARVGVAKAKQQEAMDPMEALIRGV